ncbi:MAG: hypothetical protein NC818_00195 [Candidatus Omnitrophica bacterium]|nr:hypothetical protein [Candidatus Omnitrophota bacterium]
MRRFYLTFIFLISVLFNFNSLALSAISPSEEVREISFQKNLSFLFSEFSKSLGKEIESLYFESQLGSLPNSVIYEPYIKHILEVFRKKGIFLHAFKITPEEENISVLKKNGSPFIAYLKDKGYVLVREISAEGIVLWIEGEKLLIPEKEFLESWSGYILSLPLVNIMAERVRDERVRGGRFIIAYAYHKENFEKLRPILDKLRQEADFSGKKLIYIDELGLIPKESIRKTQKTYKIEEKEAFERASKALAEEVERFSRGVSTYDENPFYQAQYSYLAKYKIISYMEELDYANWRHIVRFDELNIHNKAINAFCRGDPRGYVKKLKEYNQGFWLYNVKERDENFRRQIKRIAQGNPQSIIFTLRGIGHYGLEEKLDLEDFTIETYVISERGFEESFISDQLCQVLDNNGVEISPEEERILILRSFPEEALRTYLNKEVEDLTVTTSLAKKIVGRLKEKEIKILSRDISYAFAKEKIKKPDEVWEYVFNWSKARGKITLQDNLTMGLP